MNKKYILPKLSYNYNDLEPYISTEQLEIHHNKHHEAYVKGANSIFERLDSARKENKDVNMKELLKELSFHIGGHVLHSLFWKNIKPKKEGGGKIEEGILKVIEEEFGSFERFKEEFTKTALSIEGSGWVALTYDKRTQRVLIMQIEKHNLNIYPGFDILMVFDFWEHAYYLDYKNEKNKFIDAFWNIIDWGEVEKRFKQITN